MVRLFSEIPGRPQGQPLGTCGSEQDTHTLRVCNIAVVLACRIITIDNVLTKLISEYCSSISATGDKDCANGLRDEFESVPVVARCSVLYTVAGPYQAVR
jgi:hypothetical protein